MESLTLDPDTSALVVVDLQRGIVSRQTAPHASADVIARAARLAKRFRAARSTIVLVRVTPSLDGRDRLTPRADQPAPAVDTVSADFADIVPEMGPEPGDVIITKRQWGAFYGTELDLQLRRRGVRTIVMCGISTNIGVESTARDAFERGYDQIFVEDALASFSAEAHQFTVATIFPRIGLVRSTEDVLAAVSK